MKTTIKQQYLNQSLKQQGKPGKQAFSVKCIIAADSIQNKVSRPCPPFEATEGKTGKQALSPSSCNSFDRDIRNWLLHIIKITLHNLLETEKERKVQYL
ncbi:hypothetical protein P8452_47282 [Trifolium repens]|nr:hypothetical protein P8452_47282 [Trifolium repens]